MTGSWLDPLVAALDTADRPVTFFFRDDDAGWGDDRLEALLDRFAATGTPLDLAVIPAELDGGLGERLAARVAGSGGTLAVHQHGWAHTNHEPEGRKNEFGPSRSEAEQRRDLIRGRDVILDRFGPDAGACFVPPWNRCTDVTARLLAEIGFTVLARDITASPLPLGGLAELPVTVDWFARVRGAGRVDPAGRGRLLAAATTLPQPVGVMLHHAVMSDDDLRDAADLAGLLAGHPAAVVRPMGLLAEAG